MTPEPAYVTEKDVVLTTGLLKTFETVGELVDYLRTKDRELGVVDNYNQYLTVHDPFDSGEDISFGPKNFN